MRGEEAVVQEQVHGGPRDAGRERLQEFDGLEEQVQRAIAPHCLECDEDASIGAEAEALGERGAAEIATERLEAGAIVRRDPDVGVEIEAVELGLMRAARADVTEVRLVAMRPWTEAPTRPARIGEPSGIELKAICALAAYSSATRRRSFAPVALPRGG